tara:strand:+ start:777 stop:1226 length:450 start_codon:yes stop_codon:yes gene_type:complete
VRYLGIDYGEKRIGLSFADELGVALPLSPIVLVQGADVVEAIGVVVREKKPDALVVGYPINMDGSIGPKAQAVDALAQKLERKLGVPVHTFDERLTTSQVEADLQSMGIGSKPKSIQAHKKKRASGELDSRVAALILQEFLESQRATDV